MIHPSAERFRSSREGVESWHCFSAGAHYHPDHVAHGPLVGVDEHHIAPGSGFDWHGHRGVTIVSYVVAGRLRHEDDRGRVRMVGTGEVLVQRTGPGIRHCEVNASVREPLVLVQATLVASGEQSEVVATALPLDLDDAVRFEVWTAHGGLNAPRWHAFVTDGEWHLDGADLAPGDSARGHTELAIAGAGQLLVWALP